MPPRRVREAFDFQARACRGMGSDLSARVLETCLADFARGGPTARLLADRQGDALTDFLPLKLLGAVHHRVLCGAAPELARHYPSVGGTPRWPEAGDALLALIEAQPTQLRAGLDAGIQTNEVARSAVFLPVLLACARDTGLALRQLELGASAGLNLLWPRWHYTLGDARWGADTAPVRLAPQWNGSSPRLEPAQVEIAERRGCDVAPIDPTDPDEVLRLQSFLWADQVERFARQGAALELARGEPPTVDRAPASRWLAGRLAEPAPGVVTVVTHSVMWDYLDTAEADALTATLAAAAARADAHAPLAHVSFELAPSALPELRMRRWPGGEERLLAVCDGHARVVNWKGPPGAIA